MLILEDDKILSLFKTEPKKALGVLFDKYYEYLQVQVFFIVKDEFEAEDIIQDLFLELWKKNKLLSNINSSLKFYLKRAAINRALNKLKGKKVFEDIEEDDRYVKIIQQPNLTEIGELELKIKNGINALPPKCKEVFVLSRENGLSYRQISDQLGISIKTVENQIGKALKILRKKILIK